MINGKKRTNISLPIDMPQEKIKEIALVNEVVQKWAEERKPKKVIIVPKKIINLVF